MAQPVWGTAAGSLGTYPAGVAISIQLIASPVFPATLLTYELLGGSFPNSVKGFNIAISEEGLITGIPNPVATNTTSNFTVRITDEFQQIRDRTFSLEITGSVTPYFTTPAGKIVDIIDGTWTSYNIKYNNVVSSLAENPIKIELTVGQLPPGLEINTDGLIQGYARPPDTPTKIYTFTLVLTSPMGNDISTYSISVYNQATDSKSNSRAPAILNYNPLSFKLNPSDPFHDFYLASKYIPPIKSGDYFAFKVIGYDFDGNSLLYYFSSLPLGLYGNLHTGWVTGTPTLGTTGSSQFAFSVRVAKSEHTRVVSETYDFIFTVNRDVKNDISWVSNSNLGTIANGTISDLRVLASSEYELQYYLIDGELPPNLSLSNNGNILGRVAQQPATTLFKTGDEIEYTFTIQATTSLYALLTSTKTFTVTVQQVFNSPFENIYFKASPNMQDRTKLGTLLNDDTLIPPEYLYRADDIYFGKSRDITYVHAYGMNASSAASYISAVSKNHYWREVTLGEIKTAVAKDENQNILYEVVYSQISDELVNYDGVSIASEIAWPKNINLNLGPWITSDTTISDSFITVQSKDFYVSQTPGEVRKLYPGSYVNMRNQLASVIGENFDSRLLPLWMRSQQANGTILGYIQAWVICYTLPDKAAIIKNNILNNWSYDINEINFTVDRYLVDKSYTYDYNTLLKTPSWEHLPSSPTIDNGALNRHDFSVLFPKKTILPKDVGY